MNHPSEEFLIQHREDMRKLTDVNGKISQSLCEEFLSKHRDDILKMKGVVGCGVGLKIQKGMIVRPFKCCIVVEGG
jgi:hypothetical protein